jgi:glycosyltransferase involved in cell wall biosynthesis
MHSRKGLVVLSQLFYPELISTGKVLTEFSVELSERGWDVHALCAPPAVLGSQSNREAPKALQFKGIKVRRCMTFGHHRGSTLSRLIFGASFMLSSCFRALSMARYSAGLVVATNPPFLGIAALLVKWLRGTPYINIVHDIYPDTAVAAGLLREGSVIARVWELVTRLIFRGAAANVVIGRDMEELVRAKLGTDYNGRVVLIPNWADPNIVPVPHEDNAFRQQHNPKNHFLVQYSGTMARIHNIEPVLGAAEFLRDQPILFQFIGDGFKKPRVEQFAREKGLTNIEVLPFQPEERLSETLSAADLGVVCLAPEFTGSSVPSKSYGILAAGVPILALVQENSEIGLTVREANCGVVVPNASAAEVASVIRSLTSEPERTRSMGRNGLAVFRQKFTLERAGSEFDQLFRETFLGTEPAIRPKPGLQIS